MICCYLCHDRFAAFVLAVRLSLCWLGNCDCLEAALSYVLLRFRIDWIGSVIISLGFFFSATALLRAVLTIFCGSMGLSLLYPSLRGIPTIFNCPSSLLHQNQLLSSHCMPLTSPPAFLFLQCQKTPSLSPIEACPVKIKVPRTMKAELPFQPPHAIFSLEAHHHL